MPIEITFKEIGKDLTFTIPEGQTTTTNKKGGIVTFGDIRC